MLHYQTLEPTSYKILRELMDNSVLKEAGFFLAGGTALALQLGHRMSTDIDMFTPTKIEPRDLKQLLVKEFAGRIDIYKMTDLGIRGYIDGVKIDMIHFPYENGGKPLKEDNIRLLAVKDISAMKVHAVANRGARRDFIDLAEILQVIPLREVMDAYKVQFKPEPSALAHTNRALTYFGDAEATPNTIHILNKRDWEQTKAIVERSVRSPNFVHVTRAPLHPKASNPYLAPAPNLKTGLPTAAANVEARSSPAQGHPHKAPAIAATTRTSTGQTASLSAARPSPTRPQSLGEKKPEKVVPKVATRLAPRPKLR